MPKEAQCQIRQANLKISCAKASKIACRSDEATAILNRHLRTALTEIGQLNKTRKRKAKEDTGPSNSAPVDAAIPRDPPKSNTKGRTKEHRIASALELRPKRTTRCSLCGSEKHNAATCLDRLK